jgi:integrase
VCIPHMLRHRCGYALAKAGDDTRAIQDWLGHRSIQHTVRYTEANRAKAMRRAAYLAPTIAEIQGRANPRGPMIFAA